MHILAIVSPPPPAAASLLPPIRFCAIPQVMAVAKLSEVCNNRDVFRGAVKISKGESCSLMVGASTFADVCCIFDHYLHRIQAQADVKCPNHGMLAAAVSECRKGIAALTVPVSLVHKTIAVQTAVHGGAPVNPGPGFMHMVALLGAVAVSKYWGKLF
jgi:hypothetical protein